MMDPPDRCGTVHCRPHVAPGTARGGGDTMPDPNLSSFIWSVADLLRGDYKQSEYGKVVLPFTVLRRLDLGKHLRERPPVEVVLPAGGTLRQLTGQHPPPDLIPHLHRCVHFSLLAFGRGKSRLRRDSPDRDYGIVVRCIFRPAGISRRELHFSTGVHTRHWRSPIHRG